MINNPQLTRTLSIVRELAKGRTLRLSDYEIGMAEDLTIGIVMRNSKGEKSIGGLSSMDLKCLNNLLEENDIRFVIPE